MKRAVIIVLDAVGVGALPDAGLYGDEGANTLRHVDEHVHGLNLPCLASLGLGNITHLGGVPALRRPPSLVGRLSTESAGKDTIIGHWEMMGVISASPQPVYPQGFPQHIIDAFSSATGRKVIGNCHASGTEVINKFGDLHLETGAWIVYTSADSVFQVAAHEDAIDLDELYAACAKAREFLVGEHAVGRVIARPFTGTGPYVRKAERRDWALHPPSPNYLELLKRSRVELHAIGKISDVFPNADFTTIAPTKTNIAGIGATIEFLQSQKQGLIFTNLVETDQVYGHRRDPDGFATSLQEFDRELPNILAALRNDDLLIITSDHGCDPTAPGSDHTREYALCLMHSPERDTSGTIERGTLADVGATAAAWLGMVDQEGLPGVNRIE